MHAKFERLLDRCGDFHQSGGKWAIKKKIHRSAWWPLYYNDMFHSIVDLGIFKVLGLLVFSYMLLTMIFAIFYYTISTVFNCHLELTNFGEAFIFSLETMATIGFGTSDIFFDDCLIVMFVLTIQVCVKLIADAMVIGIIYSRLSTPIKRASTMIFSKNAVIRRIRGKLYLMLQICELRKHQLNDVHVRMYLVRRDVDLQEYLERHKNGDRKHSISLGGDNELQTRERGESDALLSSVPRVNYGNSSYGNSSVGIVRRPSHNSFRPFEDDYRDNESDSHREPLQRKNSWAFINPSPLGMKRSSSIGSGLRPHAGHGSVSHAATLACAKKRPALASQCRIDFQTCMMRLRHPSDELGGRLLPSLPQVIVHELDEDSPLMAPPVWVSSETGQMHHWQPRVLSKEEEDVEEEMEALGDKSLFDPIPLFDKHQVKRSSLQHSRKYGPDVIKLSNMLNKLSSTKNIPDKSGKISSAKSEQTDYLMHAINERDEEDDEDNEEIDDSKLEEFRNERKMLDYFMWDRRMEIIVVVEGTDAATGGTVQARHSYSVRAEDIKWHYSFEKCVYEDPDDGSAVIDFGKFHELKVAPVDTSSSGILASYM